LIAGQLIYNDAYSVTYSNAARLIPAGILYHAIFITL